MARHDPIYTLEDIAQHLGVHISTLFRWRRRMPEFPAPTAYHGRLQLYSQADLDLVERLVRETEPPEILPNRRRKRPLVRLVMSREPEPDPVARLVRQVGRAVRQRGA